MTDRYAVFGHPIAHSRSPRIHALFAAQTGQSLSYEAILAPLDGFADALQSFHAEGGIGANVTVPFKEEAFRLAVRRTPRAEAAGAVNTLQWCDDGWLGDNTDGAGLVRDLSANLGYDAGGRRILLLGAGGAARGVLLPLLELRPAELFIANRTAEKAARLAVEFARLAGGRGLSCMPEGGGFDELAGRCFDLVIDATSSGLSDAELPLPAGLFADGALAYEMVYGRTTSFMRQAKNSGAARLRVSDGLGMLVEQAAESFLLWRGVRPLTAPVIATLRAAMMH